MVDICPSVTAFDAHDYRTQMEVAAQFASRVHIDLMDGIFTPTRSPSLEQVWWPENLVADIHLMHSKPFDRLDHLKHLKPDLVIWHYEAEVDHLALIKELRNSGIKVGLSLLPKTSMASIKDLLPKLDHVLIFSGDLGRFGGQADLGLLAKARAVKVLRPELEIGWDGGINDQNAKALVEGGISVLNVGGFIQRAADPGAAYAKLVEVTS